MESFATLIKSRKSTRKFTDQLLNPEQVEMILKAALMAPQRDPDARGGSRGWK